jgi:hypothetical protein
MNSSTKAEGKVTKKRYGMVHTFVDIVVVLLFLSYGLFRSASVQTYLVKHITSYLSNQLKTEITISGVDVSWFFNIVLEDLKVNDQKHKTLLSVDKLVLDVKQLRLSKHTINFGSIRFVRADVRLVKSAADSSWNYDFIVKYFSLGAAKPAIPTVSKPWTLSVKDIDLLGSRFMLQDQTMDTVSKGVNFNNLRIKDINLKINGLRTVKDSVFGNIQNLSAKEQSGFDLKAFSSDIKFSPVDLVAKKLHLVTNRSDVRMDLQFEYHNLSAFGNFIDSVSIHSKILSSQLNIDDIGFFVPDMKGMDNQLKLEGEFSGKVNNLRAKDFKFEYGKKTHFDGNITLSGLPNIKETFVHLSVKELKSTIADLRTFKLPEGKLITLDSTIDKFGTIGIKGFFTGFYNDFVSYADFKTNIGNFSTDLSVKKSKKPIYISYKGKLIGQNVDIGKLFSEQDKGWVKGKKLDSLKHFALSDWVGRMNMDLQVEGKGIDLANLEAHLVGTIDSMEFKGNKIDNINVSGAVKQKAFSGQAKIRDELIKLDFDGKVDLNKKLPLFDFTASMRDARLTRLNLIARDTSATLTAHMNLNFEGNNIDDLWGKIVIDSTLYTEKGKLLPLNSLVLETKSLPMGDKQILLRSDYLDGDVTGVYSFTRFYNSLNLILNKYLPSLRLWNAIDPTDQFPQNFFYNFTLKNTDAVTSIFVPDLKIASNTNFKGSFSAPNRSLIINGDATSMVYKGLQYKNIYLHGTTLKDQLIVNSGASRIELRKKNTTDSTSVGLDSVNLKANVAGDSIRYRFNWNDKGNIDHNWGDISGYAAFLSLSRINLGITEGQLMLNDSVWTINAHNAISIDSTSISIDNFAFSGKHERLLLQGNISENPEQKLNVFFQQVDISGLDKFINVHGVDINGIADGSVSLMNLYHSPSLLSNLNILGLQYNNVPLGDASIRSSWNDQENAVLLDMHVVDSSKPIVTEPISATGSFRPSADSNNFNFNVTLKDVPANALSPFLEDIMSGLKGQVSGNMQLLGSSQFPYLKGDVNVKNGSLKIDYLNTRYTFNDTVRFSDKAISFRKFIVKDTLGHSGEVNGDILNKSFNNWSLNLSIDAQKLLGFNKAPSFDEMYYGKAFASGNITLTGPIDNLNFSINANSEEGTKIYIPLNNPTTVSENDFITFVNKSDTLNTSKDAGPTPGSGLSMNMNIKVLDNAQIQMFLPYEMGNITGTGNGQLRMDVNNTGDFSIFGDYTFSKGSFLFRMPKYTLERSFAIQDGSVIRWSGSPYDATINLKAAYSPMVSLSSLPNMSPANLSSSGQPISQRIRVDCIISLKDNLFKPKIKFSINLPGADENTKRLVYSAIDTTNEAEMNQQMISLLVVGSFTLYNENKSLASSLGAQPYELISNQLNNMLSQISTDFDIGVNYHQGDALTTNEVELMVAHQLFNDRLRVEANGNFATSNNNANNVQRSNNLVGDVNIDYKLTADGRLMLKAYNKVNRDIIDVYAPYKQGLGISYRKGFDSFKDLFKKKIKIPKKIQ